MDTDHCTVRPSVQIARCFPTTCGRAWRITSTAARWISSLLVMFTCTNERCLSISRKPSHRTTSTPLLPSIWLLAAAATAKVSTTTGKTRCLHVGSQIFYDETCGVCLMEYSRVRFPRWLRFWLWHFDLLQFVSLHSVCMRELECSHWAQTLQHTCGLGVLCVIWHRAERSNHYRTVQPLKLSFSNSL